MGKIWKVLVSMPSSGLKNWRRDVKRLVYKLNFNNIFTKEQLNSQSFQWHSTFFLPSDGTIQMWMGYWVLPQRKCLQITVCVHVEGGGAGRRELPIFQSHSKLMVYKPVGSFTFISLKHLTSFLRIITSIVSDIDSLRRHLFFFNCIEIELWKSADKAKWGKQNQMLTNYICNYVLWVLLVKRTMTLV